MAGSEKKVAIVHDWLTGFRGGERVLEAIAELYPEAEIYTLFHVKGSTSPILENRKIHTTFLNKIPGIQKNYRMFLPLFPLAIKTLHIPQDVNLVISSSHCVAKGITIPSHALHFSYIHSPMRYIYDQFDAYFSKESFLKKAVGYCIRPYLQTWDFISNSTVHYFISNSRFVSQRIRNFYQKNSEVIMPFVDLKDFRPYQSQIAHKEDFYLMVTALAPNKRVDLAISAFTRLGWKLKIVGTGQDEAALLSAKSENIEFLGQKSREEIIGLMRTAKAFIFPGTEDFGITPLESLAAGTPVIAYRGGGVVETLNDKVALFFNEQTVDCLIQALKNYRPENYETKNLFNRAEEFSKEKFQKRFLDFVQTRLRY